MLNYRFLFSYKTTKSIIPAVEAVMFLDILKLVREPGEIPLLRVGATTINKWGMDGADAKYQGAPIDPAGGYVFSGHLGAARLTAIQLSDLTSDSYQAFGSLSGDQFQTADNGQFQMLLTAKKPKDW